MATTTAHDDGTASTKPSRDDNLALLSKRGRRNAIQLLLLLQRDEAQQHVVANWPPPGTQDDGKIRLAQQLADLNDAYPGGLTAYLTRAKQLLQQSANGTNPFSEYTAHVPEGERLSFDGEGTLDFAEMEQLGLECVEHVAVVLVAGGLGERLGYSGIKLSLECNLCSNKSYLEYYICYIQAMQHVAQQQQRQQTGGRNRRIQIPLVIMTSKDTDAATRRLLSEHDNFGLEERQITIVVQDKVPALRDIHAGLALEESDRWTVQTKPHGHGDVHHLLHREGLVDKWQNEGKKYVIFLQDTNALAINSIIPTLGVSRKKGFHMNSICIPRLAGEAAGAIVRLEHKSNPEKNLVINVEYNLLDPLLRTQGDCKGDVADPETGYSPFPGNVNNIVIEMDAYAKTLRGEDQGVVAEFVNPKYKDDTRREFKKPTRLECMMQDIPTLFQKEMGEEAKIGFTMFDRWFTFSPAKNSLESGIDAMKKGSLAPDTMSSAESDKYIQNQRKLKFAGMDIPVTTEDDLVTIGGIPVTPGPRVILCPAFAISQQEILDKIKGGKITQRSSLILEGHNLFVKNLDLDGALVIRAGPDSHVIVDGLKIRNDGWKLEEIPNGANVTETFSIRGYTMTKHDSAIYIIKEPGKFLIGPDGKVKKLE